VCVLILALQHVCVSAYTPMHARARSPSSYLTHLSLPHHTTIHQLPNDEFVPGSLASRGLPHRLMAFDSIAGGVGVTANGAAYILPTPPGDVQRSPQKPMLADGGGLYADGGGLYATVPLSRGEGRGDEDFAVGPHLHIFDKAEHTEPQDAHPRGIIYATVAHAPEFRSKDSQQFQQSANLNVSAPSRPIQYTQVRQGMTTTSQWRKSRV
jgi:hypothetical protein